MRTTASAKRSLICCLLLLLLPALHVTAGEQPDIKKLAAAAENTRKHLTTAPASWTMVIQGRQDPIHVEVLSAPPMRRIVVRMPVQGRDTVSHTIVERDGLWYVQEFGKAYVCRPYEAVFAFASMYWMIACADPLPASAEQLSKATLDGVDGGVATYWVPVPPNRAAFLRRTVDEVDATLKTMPDLAEKPQGKMLLASAQQAKLALEKGQPVRIDLATGLIVERAEAPGLVGLEGFQWLKSLPADALSVPDPKGEDRTGDPLGGDKSQLVLAAHNPFFRINGPVDDHDLTVVTLDLKTGRTWRVPFRGYGEMPGCFLKDRQSVVLVGMTMGDPLLGLYVVDLKTGATRRLGDPSLASAPLMFPLVSHDGKTVAAQHMRRMMPVPGSQIVLIDLATDKHREVGPLMDAVCCSWLADDQGLIIRTMRREVGQKEEIREIARMDLAGHIVTLRRGDDPVAMPDGKRVLFLDRDDVDRWKTCDLDGKDLRFFGDGLAGMHDPTFNPDGKMLLMTRVDRKFGPVPFLVDPATTKISPVSVPSGQFVMPQWR